MSKIMEVVERIVCDAGTISPVLLHTDTRKGEIVEARQIIMFLANRVGVSERVAAGYYGLDHSTCNHAKKRLKELRSNPGRESRLLDEKLRSLEEKMDSHLPNEMGYFDSITLIEKDIEDAENRLFMLKKLVHQMKLDQQKLTSLQDAEVIRSTQEI